MSTHTVERGGINVSKWEFGEEEEKQRAEKMDKNGGKSLPRPHCMTRLLLSESKSFFMSLCSRTMRFYHTSNC